MRIIRHSLPYILTPVPNIINSSLLSSTYLDAWKLAGVVPIPKEGNREIASNNRPISLLPLFSKVCEKVALNQLTDYLNKHNLLSPRQSGVKRNHSTGTININVTDRILKSMDRKILTCSIDPNRPFESIRQYRSKYPFTKTESRWSILVSLRRMVSKLLGRSQTIRQNRF